jgi:hypothetical protein
MMNNPSFNSFEKFLNYGRFALVKFKTEKDALRLYLEKVKISVPLANGRRGMPLISPGELLKKYLEESK